ncbi:HNH endonuclease [Deinococcus aquatilis]|uniref:HNH endonuclease n=1 Tax=Deinococcus aquatilis TaxID=519440 RepID=UPI0009FE8228|nr:HNH endonuclease [Deinococcus aquatilis]
MYLGQETQKRRLKRYAKRWNRETHKAVLVHRAVAAEQLGRPLLPGEIVHQRDGNSLNNAPENLLVLPNQRYHAHAEYHLRCGKRGQSALFPEFSKVSEKNGVAPSLRPCHLWSLPLRNR